MIKSKKIEWIAVSLVLVLGFALRAYNFFDLSFFHDELSALTRTEFDSISTLFSKGILVDGHPPLIQVFLYFWTQLFGYEEWIVKLPFLVVAMASLYMLYKMSKALSNSWLAALGVLAFFATNQLHISYSTIARMYITGFLFSVSLVYFWWKWLESYQKRDFTLMIIFALLGAYNHHFNLLFAILVWSTGWFYINSDNKKSYLMALGIVFLCYLPSIYISSYQLFVTKGLNWMVAPDLSFITEFVQYFFHFRLFFALLILAGTVQLYLLESRVRKIILLSFGWFIISFSIAYLYSVYVAPVIQYHLMLFALPFPILAALVGWEQLLKNTKFIIFIGLITLVNLFTLIKERKHYDYFAKQSYKTLAEEVSKFDHLKTLVVTDLTLKYLDFYLKQDNTSIDTLSLDKLNSMSFDNVKKNYDYIVTCGVSEALESYFTPYYGSIQPSIQGFGYEIDVLKRQEKAHQNKQNISHTSFTSTEKGWYYNTNNITENNSYLKSENDEWGPNYENALGDSLKQKLLCFQIDYTGDSIIGEQFLVINFIDKAGKEISNNIFPFSIEKKDAGKQTIKALYDLDELPKNVHAIKAFHWKRSKTNISIHQMDLSTLDKLQAVSFITDSLEDVRSFNKRNQENWGELSYNKVLLNNETGQQYFEFDDAKQWLTSYTFDFDYKRTYTLEFEFMADEVSPLSSVILSVKNMDTTVYWTEKRLNTFMKSDNLSWSKATLAIPFSVLNEHDGIPLEISLSAYKGTGPPIKFKNPLIRSYKPNRALYGSTGEIIE